MYIYVDFSNEIIVFPLCTAKGGDRVIEFVIVFVLLFICSSYGVSGACTIRRTLLPTEKKNFLRLQIDIFYQTLLVWV